MGIGGITRFDEWGPKRHWRRTVVNDVLRRTAGREATEMLLYLPGATDEDRPLLISKGVPNRNLMAVDRSAANVARVRSAGGCAVRGELSDVMASWPDGRPVCAVLADFCCGFEPHVSGLFGLQTLPAFNGAVMMVNMMRGRDARMGRIQTILSAALTDSKHRGRQLVALLYAQLVLDVRTATPVDWLSLAAPKMVTDFKDFEAFLDCRYYEYGSQAGVVFDSVVFNGIKRRADAVACERGAAPLPRVQRRLAAQFAHRTMGAKDQHRAPEDRA